MGSYETLGYEERDGGPGEADAFADAWARFCEATADAVMPEATFQAWFAHFLIGPFALRRVAREPDFNPTN